ncbi:Mov34/MPN/PAD-1 family protein [Trichomonas vaginalis G3]|uniref:Mov34/MPN/PAD-1 family protein n=1 Tax=Trichomonas vaginalis (strain ATCC PRA-98 / G3) TaxID=412133 RepID=A2DZC5_TRIV3|nr:eukaryotic translation initiation factor 3 subunit F family protein [Trichomonas vaginalis G3]EAY14254.1 Mov34/MPN/PAD-1 family protein [Trichomonas vaginalis G3]KAI5491888.1 eukaryotic translation initiation factor 3 subunit F family protein [Trichomonas vaginalis G3]|eukprot:XP_001326477.1 Mov34/MPN/PAD-1 family protein [Trichomonas vaginalis G3]
MDNQEGNIIYNDKSISDPSVNIAQIHPLVIFKIADMYLRRGPEVNYCVGLLLGEILNREAIIRDVVPLKPGQENETDIASLSYQQHHMLYPNEKILGWYSYSEQNIEFPSIIAEGSSGIHVWMRPYVPPKIDVFSVNKNSELHLVSLPIQYNIEANIPEQLSLSRVADATSHGSLQAAINELRLLLKTTNDRISTTNYDRELCRKVHKAIAQADLNPSSLKTLADSRRHIDDFMGILDKTNERINDVQEILSIQWK